MKKTFALFGFLWICLAFGCATTTQMGSSFAPVTQVPNDKAVVYVYKAKAYGGALYKLTANGEPVTQLQKGGYYPYIADPGLVKFSAYTLGRIGDMIPIEPTHSLEINVSADEIHYVKITSGLSVRLVEVPQEKAQKELKKCKLLPEWESD